MYILLYFLKICPNFHGRDLVNDSAGKLKYSLLQAFCCGLLCVKTDYKNALYILKSEQNKYMSTVVIKQERHKMSICSI